MLHQSILPCHKNFTRLLSKLAYVVVDEGHAYRYAMLFSAIISSTRFSVEMHTQD